MSKKRYVDLDAMQYYESKWKLKFEELAINDDELDEICEEAINGIQEWSFTIDTRFVSQNNKKTGIPFNLYNQSESLRIDWGDGTSSRLTAADYALTNTSASLHEYENPGEYTITVKCLHYSNLYVLGTGNDTQYLNASDLSIVSLYWWRHTLKSVNNAIPLVKGMNRYRTFYSNRLEIFSDDLSYLFYQCYELSSVPQDLFEKNPSTSIFYRCFSKCSSLTSIPEKIFDKRTNSNCTFTLCFENCTSLSSIPEKLFYGIEIGNFNSCFSGCNSLASIPAELFSNINGTSFASCFCYCKQLTSIPANLFNSSTNATSFNECFSYCESLTSIPSNIFKFNTNVEDFSFCFSSCKRLQSLPANLFNSPNATTFNGVFHGCESLTSIPGDMFAVAGENGRYFEYAFQLCNSLTSIPYDLFSENYYGENFEECFYGCRSITSIPSGLFPTLAQNFSGCFNGCTSLTTVPSDLFSGNYSVYSLEYLFDGCSSLRDFTLYIDSSNVDSAYGFVPYKSNVDRTVYVPANSTTADTFNDYAEEFGIAVVEV